MSQLQVNWLACRGRGLCHEVAPELIDLDPWGYPILLDPLAGGRSRSRARDLAREAVSTCPVQALRTISGSSA